MHIRFGRLQPPKPLRSILDRGMTWFDKSGNVYNVYTLTATGKQREEERFVQTNK
jgi:hypothetical protein